MLTTFMMPENHVHRFASTTIAFFSACVFFLFFLSLFWFSLCFLHGLLSSGMCLLIGEREKKTYR
jgi:Na+/proline symporter